MTDIYWQNTYLKCDCSYKETEPQKSSTLIIIFLVTQSIAFRWDCSQESKSSCFEKPVAVSWSAVSPLYHKHIVGRHLFIYSQQISMDMAYMYICILFNLWKKYIICKIWASNMDTTWANVLLGMVWFFCFLVASNTFHFSEVLRLYFEYSNTFYGDLFFFRWTKIFVL